MDVQIGTLHLTDKIEWDLSSNLTPELFAAQLCSDLGLTGEAAPMISHAIHEELLQHKRSCLESGLAGRTVQKELSGGAAGYTRGPKQLEGVWRQWADTTEFGPRVEELTLEDMERLDFEREKAAK